MTVKTEQTRKSLDTRIRDAAATAGLTVETTMVNGMLRYRIDGETLTPGQALDKATAAAKEQQFKVQASKLTAPQLNALFDQLKAEGDSVPLRLLMWVGAEYGRALQDPNRR